MIINSYNYNHVRYSLNVENRAIKFTFHNDENDKFSYSLIKGHKNKKSFRSSLLHLLASYSWIRSVAMLNDTFDRSFKAIQDGSKPEWIINLIPAFETKFKISEIDQISTALKGVYRYKDENDKIVYIGKGNIRGRLREIGRISDWDIHLIEISEIESEELQFKWENYWLNRFKQENNGNFPMFNRNQGKIFND
jgi:hypothetical protein